MPLLGSLPDRLYHSVYEDKLVFAAAAATDATGVKLSYTAPSDRSARVVHISWVHGPGTTAVIQAEIVRGATTVAVRKGSAGESVFLASGLPLQAGDTVRISVVTAGVVGDKADLAIGVLEQG